MKNILKRIVIVLVCIVLLYLYTIGIGHFMMYVKRPNEVLLLTTDNMFLLGLAYFIQMTALIGLILIILAFIVGVIASTINYIVNGEFVNPL